MRRRLVAGLIVAVGLATAGAAYAGGQPADPAVASDSAAATPGRAEKAGRPGAGRAGVLKGAIHGELLLRAEDGSTRTVTFDRGKVTAVSGDSITIERPDGVSVAKGLTDRTVFNGTPRDKLEPGMAVAVISAGDTAERVLSKGARAERRLEKRQGRLERRQERLERRKERREGRAAGEEPAAGPSSFEDDGLETIVS